MSIVTWLQFGSAASAFAAASFWAWSASGEAPKMTFKGVDDLMPYFTRSALQALRARQPSSPASPHCGGSSDSQPLAA
jgi:hypothetical protein